MSEEELREQLQSMRELLASVHSSVKTDKKSPLGSQPAEAQQVLEHAMLTSMMNASNDEERGECLRCLVTLLLMSLFCGQMLERAAVPVHIRLDVDWAGRPAVPVHTGRGADWAERLHVSIVMIDGRLSCGASAHRAEQWEAR
jgi:hypothetical protein